MEKSNLSMPKKHSFTFMSRTGGAPSPKDDMDDLRFMMPKNTEPILPENIRAGET